MKTTTRKYARKRVHTEILTITPALAAEMLATMPEGGNRRLRHSHAEMLAGLIKGGHWHLTHSGIAFDQAGRLIDGQHRLTGVVLAELPAEMMVTYGLPHEAMDGIDRGSGRAIHDVLHLAHGVAGGATLSAVLRVLHREFRGDFNPLTVPAALEVYRAYKPGVDWALSVIAARTAMNKPAYRAAFALAHIAEARRGLGESAASFVEDYRTGAHMTSQAPAWRLREFTTKLNLAGADEVKTTEAELFMIACNALVAHFDGRLVAGVSRKPDGVARFREWLKKGGAS